MKTSTALLANINKENLDNLTRVVDETIAYNTVESKSTLSAAQLWNIQRQHKTVSIRRYYM